MRSQSDCAVRRHRRVSAPRRKRRLLLERLERRDLLTTVELPSVADNTLYEDDNGLLSNGAGEYFFAGRVGNSGGDKFRRGLIRFGLSTIPSTATINSVTLDLNMSRTRFTSNQAVSLHTVLADWGEAGRSTHR